MNPINELLQNFWIIKQDNKEMYREVKRMIPTYKKFLTDQVGWNLITNEKFIKLEKVPAYAQSFMGIQSFSGIRDYCILCAVLMYLEDKEDREQFLLSEIVSVVGVLLSEYLDVDWVQYEQRKAFIRVMNYCVEKQMLLVHEESDEGQNGFAQEALYENTGYSRYFATTFQKDLSNFKSYLDFENNMDQNINEERGHYRLNRLYRQLITCPAIYWRNSDNQDSQYIKGQRQWIQKYMDEQSLGTLQLHKNAAFLVLDEHISYGSKHPNDRMLSEIVLLVCAKIRYLIIQGTFLKQEDETVNITRTQFATLLQQCNEEYQSVWTKEYQSMDGAKMEEAVLAYMVNWMFIKCKDSEVIILPSTGKLIGKYLHKQEEVPND